MGSKWPEETLYLHFRDLHQQATGKAYLFLLAYSNLLEMSYFDTISVVSGDWAFNQKTFTKPGWRNEGVL